MTKEEAKILHKHYSEIIEKYTEAKIKLADGLVREYSVEGLKLTRFDLDKITATINDAIKKRDECAAIMNGKARRGMVSVIPRDI